MEVCRLSELLIRHSRSSIALRNASRLCLCTSPPVSIRPRSFNTTARRRQQEGSSGNVENSSSPPTEHKSSTASTDALGNLIGNTMKQVDLSAARDEPNTRPQKAESKDDDGDKSLADLLQGVIERRELAKSQKTLPAMDILDMENWGAKHAMTAAPPPKPQELNFKLDASVGRMVHVDTSRGVDIARAFKKLDIVCFKNRIKSDSMRQRFHERPGLRRKRLKSERWRRRFKEGFRAVVVQVRAMKKQGW